MRRLAPLMVTAFLAAVPCQAKPDQAKPVFDPTPWLADLAQAQSAFRARYANLEWAVFDREADLPALFSDARKHIRAAQSPADARAAFDGLARRLGDGHVVFDWPQAAMPSRAATPCGDYDASRDRAGLASSAQGYVALAAPPSSVFPAGIIASGGHHVGVIRIGVFEQQGMPQLCRRAMAALGIAAGKPCDQACSDRIDAFAVARMTEDFMARIEALRRTGADTLLVDITDNGGGSEWAEAAARIVTPMRLVSERVDFVRGPQWTKEFGDLADRLRRYAMTAGPHDRAVLAALARQAAAKRVVAQTPCDSAPLWRHQHPHCSWLGEGFYASGLIAASDPEALRGKPWAATVFTPMEFPYRQGVWRGPLIVLVDRNVGSAATEFTAVLQDNHAAIVLGEPTGGGCGHTDGGTPTVLAHSRAKVSVPDCARLRADGSNEVRGIRPDVPVVFGPRDGSHQRAARILEALPQAVRQAAALAP